MAIADTRTAPAQGPPDLGVLLVHGIGEQKQGETLNEFGGPILKWFDQWLEPDRRLVRTSRNTLAHVPTKEIEGRVAIHAGSLRPPDLPLGTPAHATVVIDKRTGVRPTGQQVWLLAESWWSPQTLPPRVTPFLLWLITRGPWILLLHLCQSFGVDVKDMARPLVPPGRLSAGTLTRAIALQRELSTFALITALWLVLSLLFVTVGYAVSLIALVPLGFVRQRVYGFLLAITGVIGDSYVLINDPVQRMAFASATRGALKWLHDQGCKKVAVVAHSQGAAVARDVLVARGAPRAHAFITLGPGIAKLDALADRERKSPQDFLWSGSAAPLMLLALLSWARLAGAEHTGFALWGFPLCIGVLALLVTTKSWLSVADALERLKPDRMKADPMRVNQPGLRWSDFYASGDPVSNGSLSTTVAAGLRRVVSRKVMVLASWLQDHTHYWGSRGDFVPRVAQALDRCAGAGLFATALGVQRLRRARVIHRRCVYLLATLRWLGIAALFVPLREFGRVRTVAEDLLDGLLGYEIRAVEGVVAGVEGAIAGGAALVSGQSVSGRAATAVLLLALLAIAAVHVWGRVVAYWWAQMASTALDPMFTPSEATLARAKLAALAVLVVSLGLLPFVMAAVWTFRPELLTWASLDAFLGGFALTSVLTLYGVIFVAGAIETVTELRQCWGAYVARHRISDVAARGFEPWAVPIFMLIWCVVGVWLASALAA